MKQLIELLGNGQCFCGETITIVENEETEIELEQDGTPIEFVTTEYRIYGECRSCGQLFNVEKVGLSFRSTNRLKELLPKFAVTEHPKNPFGYKKNRRK